MYAYPAYNGVNSQHTDIRLQYARWDQMSLSPWEDKRLTV